MKDNDSANEPTPKKAPAGFSPAPKGPSPMAEDAIDLTQLRLSQDFGTDLGVKKLLVTVPVRKPDRQWWVRAHPDHYLQTALLNLKEEREAYLVERGLWAELPGDLVPMELRLAVNRQGVMFLWMIKLPGPDGRLDSWSTSAIEAVSLAQKAWTKVVSNMGVGAYDIFEAGGDLGEPQWPDTPFDEIVRVAFKGRFIQTPDHAVLKRLRGEV